MKKTSLLVAFSILIITILWIGSGQFRQNNSQSDNENILDNKEDQETKINVRIQNSIAKEINKVLNIQGQTNANKIINIKAETAGKITKIHSLIGKKINKGDLIFKLSEEDLIINIDEKKSKFNEMKIEYNAEKSLFETGLSSNSKLASAESNLAKAKSDYETIKNEIKKTYIYAPFDGILTSEHLEVGEFVQLGTNLGRYIELNPILIIGYVSEKELKNLKVGTKAIVNTSLNENVEGYISYISPIAEKDTRTFKIEIEVSNNNLSIKDGLTASIEIQGNKIKAHKISPSILSLRDNGEIGIKIVNENNVVEFYNIEVISDTKDGMWVTGIPNISNIIVVGQDYAPIGDKVNLDKIN